MKKQFIFLIVFMCLIVSANIISAQVITTFAGSITGGYAGDHGQATAAKLNTPSGVAVDKYGNVYITDQNASCVRMVDTNGIITSVVSNSSIAATGYSGDGGPASAAKLYWPEGLGIDDSGNLYIADQFNNVIRKVTKATGIITTFAGNQSLIGYGGDGGLATNATLWHPTDVGVDRGGNVYFVDQDNSIMRKVNASTRIITTIAGIPASPGFTADGVPGTSSKLNSPQGIAVDTSGNVYIADFYNSRIRKVTAATGIISTVAGNGTGGYSGDGGPATNAEIWDASAVAIDDTGNIYISDYYNSMIRKVSVSTGIISRIAGNDTPAYCCDCHIATAAEIYYPEGVAVDKKGNVYIADFGNSRVRKVSTVFTCPALNEPENTSFQVSEIYPNPSQGRFCIELNNLQKHQKIEIYNVLGEKVYETDIYALKTDLDLYIINEGVYTVCIKSDENYIVKKLIITY